MKRVINGAVAVIMVMAIFFCQPLYLSASAAESGVITQYSLGYTAHCQSIGWMEKVSSGEQAGTTGLSKRMEAISIEVIKEVVDLQSREVIGSQVISGAIEYQAHCQGYGDMEVVGDGGVSGTIGETKRLEAIRIALKGELSETYDIWYQVHCAGFGDMGWAKNGEWAGSNGYARSIEAITILMLEKGSLDAPYQGSLSFISRALEGTVSYSTHVQKIGWMKPVSNGAVSGTQGQSKRMEALTISMDNPKTSGGQTVEGSIEYMPHIAKKGWLNWCSEGTVAGTTGESRALQAIRIRLTGQVSEKYDVYYRVHSAGYGTLGWAKNGEVCGTVGYDKAIESIEICLMIKGNPLSPVQNTRAGLDKDYIGDADFSAYVMGNGWQSSKGYNQVIGTTKQSKSLEAISLDIESGKSGAVTGLYEGGLTYSAHRETTGWTNYVSDGQQVGVIGSGKKIEAVRIDLTGELKKYCDIYYRAHVESFGWLGWAKNGGSAGSCGYGYRLEALQIVVIPKGTAAPGSTKNAFKQWYSSNSVSVPRILQNPELPTGCESVALTIALHHYGYNIGKTVIADTYLPYNANFAIGFCGDPYSSGGAGCFAPAITTAANKFLTGKNSPYRAIDITGTAFPDLYEYIDNGHPVIIWGTMYMMEPIFTGTSVTYNGRVYQWYRREHCMVLYGYNRNNDTVLISDPLSGLVVRPRADFERLYNITGKNAVSFTELQ